MTSTEQEELNNLKNNVNGHFEKTAVLFNEVSESYQALYDHMAKSANLLCATDTFQSLPNQAEKADLAKLGEKASGKPQLSPVFDANQLYNAHDYLNDSVENDDDALPEAPAEEQAVVVDIETTKDGVKPARDYAITNEQAVQS